MFRFTIRNLLWLMVVVGLALGWWVDHSATRKLAEAYESELSSAKMVEQAFLEFSHGFRRDRDALEAVIRYERSGALAGEELIWKESETTLSVDVEIPFGYKRMLIEWGGSTRPADGKIPAEVKPAFNCLGAVLVSARGHIPIRTGLMTIHDSIPRYKAASAACAVYVAPSKDTAQIILPDLFRSSLGPGQHCIAIYGGWRDDITTFAAQNEGLDTQWQFFSLRRLSIVE